MILKQNNRGAVLHQTPRGTTQQNSGHEEGGIHIRLKLIKALQVTVSVLIFSVWFVRMFSPSPPFFNEVEVEILKCSISASDA